MIKFPFLVWNRVPYTFLEFSIDITKRAQKMVFTENEKMVFTYRE